MADNEKPGKDTGHPLSDIEITRRIPARRGILDKLGAEEALPEQTNHRVMANDSVSFLGGIYHVVRVNLETDTVSFYVGDDLRTYPRSLVSKVKSCAVDPKPALRRKR